jgi:hypothetical protein
LAKKTAYCLCGQYVRPEQLALLHLLLELYVSSLLKIICRMNLFTVSMDVMIVNDELQRIWKEAASQVL